MDVKCAVYRADKIYLQHCGSTFATCTSLQAVSPHPKQDALNNVGGAIRCYYLFILVHHNTFPL